MLLIAVLGGCESKTGDDQAQAEAPTATNSVATGVASNIPADTYAPGGLDGATVMLKPAGKALISVVAGYPARIYEGAAAGEYRQARLMPGDYILNVGNIDARQGLNLSFHGESGDYYALALTYTVDGELFWTPVIVSGAPNGPIVADKDGLLIGKTQADAIKLLAAGLETSGTPAARAEALYRKGMELLTARKPKPAFEAFGESIRVKPTVEALAARANLSFARGEALGKKGDWDGAEPFFKSAQADADKGIELAPKSVGFWTLKTGTHMMLNQHEQACSAMRKACELGNCSILEQSPQCKPGGS